MEEENVKSDSRDSLRRHYEEDTKTSELRFEGFNGGNSGIAVTDGEEDLERNEISVKARSRVFSGVGSIAARYKSMSPARLPISRSPCLTIPPGFSPTSLLDSPVLLSNMKPEPSPTTGTFSKPQMMHVSVVSSDSTCDERRSGDFEFKPHIRSASDSGLSSLAPPASTGLNQQQSDSFMQVQVQGQCHQSFASPLSVKCENITASSHELTLSVTAPNLPVHMIASRASVPAEVATDDLHQRPGLDGGIQASQSEHNGTSPSVIAEKSSEDGYNWRKYGQKHVKGSEFPRSYYKCTHPNCEVKKLLERSHVGQIKEIIYKGRHDHPKPQPNRRLAVGTVLSIQEERPENLSALTSTGDKSSNGHGQTSHYIDPNGTPELSPVTASDDDVEGAVTQSNRFIDGIDDDDDPESKRRKKDISGVDVTPLGKPTREPRVVVQTLSEVDILDDGYRWRKYGQKVVKGNPNPRSYYKCTNAGCPVRKHVERASHDPKAVITTYEGKHNHDVPAARTSSHDIAGNATTLNSMLKTRSDENDTISLDLGVGISLSPENRSNDKQQTPDTETDQSQTHIATHSQGNVIQATPISTYHASLNDGMDRHGSREDRVESFSFKNPSLNHSSNSFQQNMGRLLMGP